jgi:hypothetical protein
MQRGSLLLFLARKDEDVYIRITEESNSGR